MEIKVSWTSDFLSWLLRPRSFQQRMLMLGVDIIVGLLEAAAVGVGVATGVAWETWSVG